MPNSPCLVWLLVLWLVACAGVPAPHHESSAAPAHESGPAQQPIAEAVACPRASSLDVAEITAEATCLLSAYVRIDTQNPPGHELAAAHFLQDVLRRDGIDSQIIESTPGRANLIARIRGKKAEGALLLTHHMDVVPANAAEWSVPPFEGVVRDGAVWGRGSYDNKGGGVIELMAALMIQRLATPLAHDLVLLAVADEEAGGGAGARFLTGQRMELFAGVEFVLAEGGGVVQVDPEHIVYSIELAQKAPLWLRLTARGRSGHGATPIADSAVTVLLRALSRLSAYRFPILVRPEVQALYAKKAPALPEALRAGALNLAASLEQPAFREQFLKEPHDAALVQNTLAITMLHASDKENVIAGEASAVLDLRLLPGQDPQAIIRELASVMAEPAIELTPILSWPAHASPQDTPLFRAIEALAYVRHPQAPVIPNVISGFTDCNAFRAQHVTCYGFLPLHVRPDAFGRIHGKDERMISEDMSAAVIDLHSLLAGLQ